jgi:hypothetical protein
MAAVVAAEATSVPRDPTDQPLCVIATPTHAIRIKRPNAAPMGIDWTRLRVVCRLPIDRFGDHETAAIVRVSQAASSVLNGRWSGHRGKEGIVEFL